MTQVHLKPKEKSKNTPVNSTMVGYKNFHLYHLEKTTISMFYAKCVTLMLILCGSPPPELINVLMTPWLCVGGCEGVHRKSPGFNPNVGRYASDR